MAELTITSDRLNELKAKVKAEMQRRCATEHNSSLSSYGNSSWDFSSTPKSGDSITDEQIQKIIDPLIEVNDFMYDNSLKTGKSGIDASIYKAEQFVDELSNISMTNSNSGCRGNCMGLCAEACTSSCTGCISCTGGCSTSCSKSCASDCGGGCNGCSGGCSSGCTATCGSGCTTSLRY